jgi:3-phosphoshikimate 1-carboxyvinyltransferase
MDDRTAGPGVRPNAPGPGAGPFSPAPDGGSNRPAARATALLRIDAPGSKSLTQRALVLAALSDRPTTLIGPLDCDDSRRLRTALCAMGAEIRDRFAAAAGGIRAEWEVVPGPLHAPPDSIDCGNAGTTIRFLAALSLLVDGPIALDGDAHMRRRPIGDLAGALERIGVRAAWLGERGFPPVRLERTAPAGPVAVVDGSRSSQYAGGLMLAAPRLPAGLDVGVTGAVVSRPYLAMTSAVLRSFGIEVEETGGGTRFRVSPGIPRRARYEVEGDWSGGAFLAAAGWIAGRPIVSPNLRGDSPQGDRVFASMLPRLESPEPQTFDLGDCPDLIAPLAAAAAFAAAPVSIRNVAHARIKESDRIEVLAVGLGAAGVSVETFADGLRIRPGPGSGAATLDPHDDHRMAMAFGLLSLRNRGLRVTNRGCVSKSFPSFWEALERIRWGVASGRTLWLIGARGSGKTTVGRLAAERIGRPFIDADEAVAHRAGRPVAAIFAEEGEAAFREAERRAMIELGARGGAVVATGGGCVLDAEMREMLAASGSAVWLDAPAAERAARIAGSDRPPLTARGGGVEEEAEVAAARAPWYRACAAVRIPTGSRAPEEVAADVERFWRELPGDDVR